MKKKLEQTFVIVFIHIKRVQTKQNKNVRV